MKLDYAVIIEIVNKTLSQFLKVNNISPEVYGRVTELSNNKTALPNMIKENFSFTNDFERGVLITKFINAFNELISTHAELSDYEYNQLIGIVENCFNDATNDL